MKRFTDDQYSKLWRIAAFYNFFASAIMLIFPQFSAKLVLQAGAVNDFYAHTFYNFTWAFVMIFGIGYFIVSLDVNKNHGVALLGILGKVFFYLYYLKLYFGSHCTLFGLAGVTGDLLFSIAFSYFLYQKKVLD